MFAKNRLKPFQETLRTIRSKGPLRRLHPRRLWRYRRRQIFGFTLIELMMVVAIISLLAAIATPKFANMVIKAKEASIKGKLGSYRSAISIYYADTEGLNPLVLDTLTVGGKYLNSLPRISVPTVATHGESNGVNGMQNADWSPGFAAGQFRGGTAPAVWAFNIVTGKLVVSCTHTDSQGVVWSTY